MSVEAPVLTKRITRLPDTHASQEAYPPEPTNSQTASDNRSRKYFKASFFPSLRQIVVAGFALTSLAVATGTACEATPSGTGIPSATATATAREATPTPTTETRPPTPIQEIDICQPDAPIENGRKETVVYRCSNAAGNEVETVTISHTPGNPVLDMQGSPHPLVPSTLDPRRGEGRGSGNLDNGCTIEAGLNTSEQIPDGPGGVTKTILPGSVFARCIGRLFNL